MRKVPLSMLTPDMILAKQRISALARLCEWCGLNCYSGV